MIKNARAKGSRLEREVKRILISKGYHCSRQAASVFPDLLAIKKGESLAIECKTNKYLSKKEKDSFSFLEGYFDKCMVAYPIVNDMDKRKKYIVLCDYKDYKEVMRL